MTGTRLQATVVRALPPYWAHEPGSGEGARRAGGRFNPVGRPALYTSFSLNTAAKEVRFALNRDPFTFYYVDVDCRDVLDLCDPATRASFAVDLRDLECPNWESEMYRGLEPASHALAIRLHGAGAAGIIVPSFAPGATGDDRNLVLWTWQDVTGGGNSPHAIRILSRDQLPSDQRSWPNR